MLSNGPDLSQQSQVPQTMYPCKPEQRVKPEHNLRALQLPESCKLQTEGVALALVVVQSKKRDQMCATVVGRKNPRAAPMASESDITTAIDVA